MKLGVFVRSTYQYQDLFESTQKQPHRRQIYPVPNGETVETPVQAAGRHFDIPNHRIQNEFVFSTEKILESAGLGSAFIHPLPSEQDPGRYSGFGAH